MCSSTMFELVQNVLTSIMFSLDYEERVLPSITNEILKFVVTQFDAIQLIIQRTLISHRTHLSFGPEFTRAVELKQVAQQDIEKQRFLIKKINE
ncbi:unnamed protein product [Rotaria sordida]|uniref:Prohibitin n=1 Tax=Rotaria sordida TaxID=392033 RepID=A0A814Y0Z4_9BILA|nr:unnamed protein product [Rotaria sordida]